MSAPSGHHLRKDFQIAKRQNKDGVAVQSGEREYGADMASAASAEKTGSMAAPDPGWRRGEGTPEPPPPPTPHPQLSMSPRTPDRASPYMKTGACFTCKQDGHWSRDCPSKKSAGRTPHLAAEGGPVEAPECPCGAGRCLTLISNTERNPGRKFFKCPAMPCHGKCNFFQWCDSPSPLQLHVTSPPKQGLHLGSAIQQQAGNALPRGDCHPICQCGAGWCIVLTKIEGEGAGRKYFACPRKESSERCNFHQWCDDFSLTGKCTTRPMHQDLVSPPCGIANTQYPDCTCGAGRCRLETMELGEYAGRKYFACPVKRGQGACNFFRWQNAAEGEYVSGKNHLVGNENQHPEPRVAKSLEPTRLNFDDVEVGEPNVRPPSTLEQRQGDAEGVSNQDCYTGGMHSASSSVSPKPGKCYRCGKEGHWMADCVPRW